MNVKARVHVSWQWCASLVLLALMSAPVFAADEQLTRMQAALAAPARPDADKQRDATRKPIETVQFLGIKTGQTVIDVLAGGGWFTEVLSAAVGPTGKVYAQNSEYALRREGFVAAETQRHQRLGNVSAIHGDLATANLVGSVDAAITAMNLHDVYNGPGGEAGAINFAKTIFTALKPGGVFGVIDHIGVAGQDNAALHRMQVAQARDVLTKAGFVIEAESPLLANPADDHTKGVRDVTGGTDQFLFRARKPK